MSTYKTLHEYGMDEIIIEKSTFIGYAKPIKTEEEAVEFINEIKKKHKDATHNVWAYTVGPTMNIQRYSDDGEPQGTAGIPTLEVIKKEDLRDVVVVVTRYFGGILLGTGGLVKAYSSACTLGLKKACIIEKNIADLYKIEINYTDIDKFKYFAKSNNIIILKEEYLENVILEIAIKEQNVSKNISQKDIIVKKIEFIKKIYV